MKPLIALFMLSLAFTIFVGCKTLNTEIAPRAAQAINAYCVNPLADRQLIRAQVNQLIAPNQVKITCQGDPE